MEGKHETQAHIIRQESYGDTEEKNKKSKHVKQMEKDETNEWKK